MNLPGNPYSLIKDGICTAVIAMQNYDRHTIEMTLFSQEYDTVINCSELGYEIFCGQQYYSEYGVWAFPPPSKTWTLNKLLRTWSPPIPYPTDGRGYNWSEEEQNWIACSSVESNIEESSINFIDIIDIIDISVSIDLISEFNDFNQLNVTETAHAN
jgi:hypothetical protein